MQFVFTTIIACLYGLGVISSVFFSLLENNIGDIDDIEGNQMPVESQYCSGLFKAVCWPIYGTYMIWKHSRSSV